VPRLAVAASATYPDLRPDWPLLQDALTTRDIEAETQVWTDPEADWDVDLVLANGAWDNIHRPDEFLAWVEDVASRTLVVNTPQTLRWNMDKRYLATLAEAGVPVVPTSWLDPIEQPTAVELPETEFVVKPAISGGGFQTARYDGARKDDRTEAQSHINHLRLTGRTVMVQPYQHGVDSNEAETGLIYLGGVYSHAIRKGGQLPPGTRAGPGLHNEASITPGVANPEQLAVAEQILAVAEQLLGPLTYARVDLIPGVDEVPTLIELELLDPALFFDHHPPAAEVFADVLLQTLRNQGPRSG
jgi:glutathione synthase/RimK-type ligase-like ATP-grasp enzyme